VDLENPTGKIKPNLMARVRTRDFHVDSALVVPSNLVQQTPSGENFVYTVSQSAGEATVKKVTVRTGKSNQEAQTLILEGLSPGDYIVQKGSRSIKEGQKVTIANS
jgi:multidrug efflux pump subunit AcrA (membrane-fusion protein)